MLKINTVVSPPLNANTYILTFFNGDAIVIDPADAARVTDVLQKENATAKAVLITHAHFDHSLGVAALQKGGAKVYMHCDDVPLLTNGNLAELCGLKFPQFTPDVVFCGDEKTEICGQTVEIIHTPGHTAGSVCYSIGGALFTGDTLFRLSVGRTDFPSGDAYALKRSLEKLFALKRDYPVYPGHGEMTNLFYEKENNPYA